MHFVQNLMDFLNGIQADKLDRDTYLNASFHFYCKDRNGKFIDSNDFQAKQAGFNKAEDILGLTDRDLCWSKEGARFLKNDKEIILTKKAKLIKESITIYNGNSYNVLSYKIPLRINTRKVIGVSGITFQLNMALVTNQYQLSKRQIQCLYYLIRGKSDREIAQSINLGPRTVESYVNQIKIKMNCTSRSSIIEKVIRERMLDIWSDSFMDKLT